MEPDLLRAFVGVVEGGGFTAAARALNRTQSAVSLQIKRLEEQVGEPLFVRTTRRCELTSTGGALLPYARRILRLHDEAAAAVDAVTQKRSLRLGISDEHAIAFLPAVMPAFAAAFPEVQLEVQCDLSTRLVELLEGGELDLALTIRHGPTATGLIVAREQLCWVAAEDFTHHPLDPLPLALNPEGCIFRAHAFASLARIQRALRVVYVSSSPTGINLAVEAGMAATVKRDSLEASSRNRWRPRSSAGARCPQAAGCSMPKPGYRSCRWSTLNCTAPRPPSRRPRTGSSGC